MNRKILVILLATLINATMFATIGVAEIEAEIPKDAPGDIEIPEKLAVEPILKIDDKIEKDEGKSTYDWNLYFDDSVFDIDNEGDGQRISYRVWNTGTDDITWNWYDRGYIKLSGVWTDWEDSEIYNTDTLIVDDYYDADYWCEFPGGWHWYNQWTDPDNDIPEDVDWDDNDGLKLWNF